MLFQICSSDNGVWHVAATIGTLSGVWHVAATIGTLSSARVPVWFRAFHATVRAKDQHWHRRGHPGRNSGSEKYATHTNNGHQVRCGAGFAWVAEEVLKQSVRTLSDAVCK